MVIPIAFNLFIIKNIFFYLEKKILFYINLLFFYTIYVLFYISGKSQFLKDLFVHILNFFNEVYIINY